MKGATMNSKSAIRLAAATCLVAGLASCGGGGDSEPATAAPATPAAAPMVDNSSLQSFLEYQRTLPPVPVIDPDTLQRQLAPIDDTAEPTRLN